MFTPVIVEKEKGIIIFKRGPGLGLGVFNMALSIYIDRNYDCHTPGSSTCKPSLS